jgi:tyrosyl-tRNA synthetase
MVVKLDGSDKVEVAEGSFVWLRDAHLEEGEVYIEWDTIKDADRGAILDLRNQIDGLTEKLAEMVLNLGKDSKNAA